MKKIELSILVLVLMLCLSVSCDHDKKMPIAEVNNTTDLDNNTNNTEPEVLIYETPLDVFESVTLSAKKSHVYILKKELFTEPFVLDFSSCSDKIANLLVSIYANYSNECFTGQVPLVKNDYGWTSEYDLDGVYYAQIMVTTDCDLQIGFI